MDVSFPSGVSGGLRKWTEPVMTRSSHTEGGAGYPVMETEPIME